MGVLYMLELMQYIYVVFCKVKRVYSDRIVTPGVIPTLECRSSFTEVAKLKTAMLIAVLLTILRHIIIA